MVRYCDQCGSELKEHAIFCSKCGAKSDLEPETNVENQSINNEESTREKVNDLTNDKTESVGDKVNENTETIGAKIDNIISKTSENSGGGFDLNNIDWNVVIKYSIVSTVVSLLLGIILFSLFYGNPMLLYSFMIGLIISVLLFTAHIKNKTNAVVVGLVVGLLTCILQSTTISIFFGVYMSSIFSMYAGGYSLALIVIGPICGYVGNVVLGDKINLSIINQYLGE